MAPSDFVASLNASKRVSKSPCDALGSFPCPEDITGFPFVATYSEVGRLCIVRRPALSVNKQWYAMGITEVLVDEWGEILLERPREPDELRASRNRARAVQRAKRHISDYIVFNRLTKMWTFTYAVKNFSREQAVKDVHEFVKRWREYETHAFPYAWVLEQHQDGSWHVHFAVQDSHFTDFFALRRLWGKGRIRFDKRRRERGESRQELQRLASYMSKYLGKDFGDEVPSGRHRYEVAEGFQPGTVRRYFKTYVEAAAWGMEGDSELAAKWWSGQDPDWDHVWQVWILEVP